MAADGSPYAAWRNFSLLNRDILLNKITAR
jgi:hypothetical protein